jgi:triosephosphate isomerase
MRIPFVAANWKMHKTVIEGNAFIRELQKLLKDVRGVEVVVAPPFTLLHTVADHARNSKIEVAAQNLHWERPGAFTGEISASMIRDAGGDYVIIGHSERRTLFGETDETVHRKIQAALAHELTPIVCIGETLDERDAGRTFDVLDRQIKDGFADVTATQLAEMVIAYEPVWAIGTGRTASPAQAQEVHAHIRLRLRQWFGAPAADGTRVIYGGSVKPDNAQELMGQPDVDGALVGGASLDVHAFADIVRKSGRR